MEAFRPAGSPHEPASPGQRAERGVRWRPSITTTEIDSTATATTSDSSTTLGQAAARYLGTLPAGQRELAASEINRFVRHMGASQSVQALTKIDVERYQQYLMDTSGDGATRVEALKRFLTDLKTRRVTEVNLGAALRVRRARGAGQAHHEEAQVIELTQEGYDTLVAEVQQLETEEIPAIRADMATAFQDGDFRENAPYHEAKRRMGEIQGRLDTLKAQLKAARIVERQASTSRVGLGSRVILRDLTYDEELSYTLVGPGEVDTRNGRISIQSPVGSALRDRGVGDEVEVQIPSGTAHYRVERIEQSS